MAIAEFGTATVQGVIGLVAGHATLPATGSAVTTGGAFRVVDFALRRGWPGLDVIAAEDALAGSPFAAAEESVTTLPDGATLRFRETVLELS
jgi:hypothetical protein